MYDKKGPIDQLVHLYVDGGITRRDLVRRVARKTGGVAAAMAALAGYEDLNAQPSPVAENVRVPANADDIDARDIEWAGKGGRLFGHLAMPKVAQGVYLPGVLVVHENRGLVEHIKDVTRRAARDGFIALSVDLLSRQGGVGQFPDAAAQTAAYGRTVQWERIVDLVDGLDYLKYHPNIVFDRIGIVGFCAGGQNVWDFIVSVPETAAAVPFYGAPPSAEDIAKIQTPVLGLYAERDRSLTHRMLTAAATLSQQQKSHGLVIYEGVGHAFHNDTGPNYNAGAATDAWARAMAFFNKFLRAPRA
ncbi:MAG: dienelactone hydrolase family protein [Acidobacteria bacterium]|nr:dienelactone hydrolase family protein [Acidobacteriota bacterium]